MANKIAADAGLHRFRKRNDLSDEVTEVPVPVQYKFSQQDTDHEVSWPIDQFWATPRKSEVLTTIQGKQNYEFGL